MARIALLQPDRTLVASAVTDPATSRWASASPGQGISGTVALRQTPSCTTTRREHAVPDIAMVAPGTVVIGVPLHYRAGKGVPDGEPGQPGLPNRSAGDVELLAPQAATAIGKAQLHEQAHQNASSCALS